MYDLTAEMFFDMLVSFYNILEENAEYADTAYQSTIRSFIYPIVRGLENCHIIDSIIILIGAAAENDSDEDHQAVYLAVHDICVQYNRMLRIESEEADQLPAYTPPPPTVVTPQVHE